MGTHEVTQTAFATFMGYDPSTRKGCPWCPVETVTWHEAARFANAVSNRARVDPCYVCSGSGRGTHCRLADGLASPYECRGFRLPTEPEWESAARAGTLAAFPGGAELKEGTAGECGGGLALSDGTLLDRLGRYCGNARGRSAPVGGLEPNAWGLYDMLGNVAEWTHGFLGSPPRDPTDPWDDAGGAVHATRGGSADMAPALLRHAARKTAPADFGDACIGLRLARTMP